MIDRIRLALPKIPTTWLRSTGNVGEPSPHFGAPAHRSGSPSSPSSSHAGYDGGGSM